jgi:hypothetical protein
MAIGKTIFMTLIEIIHHGPWAEQDSVYMHGAERTSLERTIEKCQAAASWLNTQAASEQIFAISSLIG